MKKILTTVVFALFVLAAQAQISPYNPFTPFDRIHATIEAGATYNKTSYAYADYKVGFRAGVGADIPLHFASVSFCPSLLFEKKGYISNVYIDLAKKETDLSAMYIEVPLDFALNIVFNRTCGMQILAGPYLAYGVAGKYNVSSENNVALYGKKTIEYNTYFNDDDSYNLLKNFDMGIDCGVRFIFSYFVVKVNAELGCINMSAIEGAPAFRNRSFSGGIALRF